MKHTNVRPDDAPLQTSSSGPVRLISRGLAVMALVLIGGLSGYWIATQASSGAASEGESHSHWTCPMHPTVTNDRAGTCPVCGMDLVRKTRGSGGPHDPAELARLGRVSLNPAARVLGNVAVAPAQTIRLRRTLRAPAKIVHDEQGLQVIAARVGGRIETLHIEETGATVSRGQKLLTLYSPALITAQEELLAAARGGAFAGRLQEEARRKLRLWGMTRAQLQSVLRQGKPLERVVVYAPAAGTVTMRKVLQGQYVTEGQTLLTLTTLSRVWLEAELFEKDISLVEVGQSLTFTTQSLPGQRFSGTVEFVHPWVSETSRTMRVRAAFDNKHGLLRPGMYAVAELSLPVGDRAVLTVPVSSAVRTGTADLVYIQVEPGVYERRKVTLGPRAQGRYQLISGVKPDELVVVSGGFLVDSEAQLFSGTMSPDSRPASKPSSAPDGTSTGAPEATTGHSAEDAPTSRPETGSASQPEQPVRRGAP